jgi:hypothetical protein
LLPNPPKSGRLRKDGRWYLDPKCRCLPNPLLPFVTTTFEPGAAAAEAVVI